MKCRNSLILFIIISFLTGCGPIYRTEYDYVPPRSNIGKMCIAQCIQNQNTCKQMCGMRKDNCRAQARQDALYDFEQYRQNRIRMKRPIDKSLSDFERSSFNCDKSCNCNSTFRACYSACGGEVLANQVCVAFCDKQ